MKKRIVATLLAGVMALGLLAGCGGTKTTDTKTEEKASASGDAAATTDIGEITLILSMRDEFLSSLEAGSIKAAETLGMKLTTQDAQNDSSKQIQFIENAKNAGQKAVIVNPVDPATSPQLIEAAGDMFVVFVNRTPATMDVLNEKVVYVGSDESTSGYFQGEALAKKFKEEGKTEISYIMLQGTIGQTSTTNRSASALKALEDNGIKATPVGEPLVADWDRGNAIDMITPLLTTAKYDCIIANNDAMALGAVEAMKSQGLDPTKTPIVGIDATVDGCAAVKNGELLMSVFQNAQGQGYGSLIAAANLVAGKAINEGTPWELDKENASICWIPFEPVTKENVDNYANYKLEI